MICCKVRLVGFPGITTVVGYVMPNPVFTYRGRTKWWKYLEVSNKFISIWFSDCRPHPVKSGFGHPPHSFWGNWVPEMTIKLCCNFPSCILVILLTVPIQQLSLSTWYPTVSEYGSKPFYGGGRARIETHARQVQKFFTLSVFSFGALQVPSNKLSPASR